MRRAISLVLLLTLGSVLSCADMPVKPKSLITVDGSVLGRDGEAIQGARLYFQVPRPPKGQLLPPTLPVAQVETKADGTFSVQLPEGEYDVTIYPPGGPGTGFPSVTVPNVKFEPERDRFDYRYSGIYVSGRVIGPEGSTPSQAYVSACSYEQYSCASTQSTNGLYKILLTPGQYHFDALIGYYESGYPQLDFDASIPPRDTTIDLDFSGYEVKVDVTFQGAPLIGASVSASKPGIHAYAHTDFAGTAKLYLPAGSYSFLVYVGTEGITGPQEVSQSIQGDATIPVDISGVAWDVTLRRQSDLSTIPQANVEIYEIVGDRGGRTH